MTGIAVPVGLSILLLRFCYRYSALASFVAGAALCSTSLGTTFAVIAANKSIVDLANTRIGTVLVSAAMIDDVVGLIMASVIKSLGSLDDKNLGWTIGRPILVSACLVMLTSAATIWVFKPAYGLVRQRVESMGKDMGVGLIVLALAAFTSIAYYTGTSVLLGAYLAGTTMSSLQPTPLNSEESRRDGPEQNDSSFPNPEPIVNQPPHFFASAFELRIAQLQHYILSPFFFASIGSAIPFLSLWTSKAVWQGVVFSILMILAKLSVGLCVLAPSFAPGSGGSSMRESLAPAGLLGWAMVSRGEIGLLIAQIAYNESGVLSEDAFVIIIWAIVICTVVGPVVVGFLLRRSGAGLAGSKWE